MSSSEGDPHQAAEHPRSHWESAEFAVLMKKRHRSEQLFRAMGLGSIAVGLAFLAILMTSIIGNGYSAFWQTHIALEVDFAQSRLDPDASGDPEVIGKANFGGLVKRSMRAAFPDVKSRRDKRALYKLVSSGAAFQLRAMAMDEPRLIGQKLTVWVPADDDIDMLMKGYVDRKLPESDRRINNKTLAWVDKLSERGAIEKHFNITFFTAGDSREPELSGIHGALMGSLYMLMVTLVLSFPIGVGAAIYLEEFAPRNRFSDFIEVNVNNLAAVPSIVFGLLGLAVFLNFFQLPRSAPLVGGLVLTLMTLPTIIIASRAALKSVPPSIREAALGIGASKMQMVMQHALPLAMPGMLTGTIIGMARALGESAPLLMIGMVAFVVDVPDGPLDPATALPVQVYLWADSPERAFVERTSAAIIVLLVLLVGTNALAVFLRRKFERRW